MSKKKVIKWFSEKPLLVFKYSGNNIISYNGTEQIEFNKNEINKYQKKYTTIFMTGKDASLPLDKAYKEYNESATALKEATGQRVNMFKTGSYPRTAIRLWQKLGFVNNKVIEPEPITDNETELINNTTTGSIQFGLKYEGKGHQYDFKSFYLSIMNDNNFLIPKKEGKEHTIKDFNELVFYNNYCYGYYRCIIHKSGNYKIDRFFRFNKKNHYTHLDLISADILGLKKEIIKDGKPNAYIYTRKEQVTSYEVFHNFVHCVWKLKEKKIKGAKQLSTSLWGGLCSGGTKRVITLEQDDPQPEGEIVNIIPNNDGTISYHFSGDGFEYDWARIKPFLLAKGRLKYIQTAFKYSDKIVRAHTDSFTTTEKIDIETGNNLGNVAYEGYFEYRREKNKIIKKRLNEIV